MGPGTVHTLWVADVAKIAMRVFVKGERPLLPDRRGLGRSDGSPEVQINAVGHSSGRRRQQSDLHPTVLQR